MPYRLKEILILKCLLHVVLWILAIVFTVTITAVALWVSQTSDDFLPKGISAADEYFELNPDVVEALGPEGLRIFKQHDRDEDGMLTPKEFVPLAMRLSHEGSSHCTLPNNEHSSEGSVDSSFNVLCLMEPFNLTSLKTKVDDYVFPTMDGLTHWTKPAIQQRTFQPRDFQHFLPQMADEESVGSMHYVVKSTLNGKFSGQLSSNRHHPPSVHEDERILHELLAMFHPRPFVYPRFSPQGTIALMRAVSEDAYDIIFRAHAEFQLNEPPLYPLWFTPGQFRGHLTINKNATTVYHFEMHVPSSRQLNVDLEWLTGPGKNDSMDNMEVDIGHIGLMQLQADLPTPPHFVWHSALPIDEAFNQLEKMFYPFKQELSEASFDPVLAEHARLALEAYTFPVESMVVLANGTVIKHINANALLEVEDLDIMDSFFDNFDDPMAKKYAEFLEEGIVDAKKFF